MSTGTDFSLRWPTDFPGRITQAFGINPQYYRQWGLPGHEGLDIMSPYGSNIYACADGEVFLVYTARAYGIHVRIKHKDGYQTIYAHLKEAKVKIGDKVVAGQVIGLADSTGNSVGSHLHLTLKREGATQRRETTFPLDIVDPTPYLLQPVQAIDTAQVIATAGLRLRADHSFSASIITVMPYGSIVRVLDKSIDGWWEVAYNLSVGWASSQYMKGF